jgi:hypothetical protein
MNRPFRFSSLARIQHRVLEDTEVNFLWDLCVLLNSVLKQNPGQLRLRLDASHLKAP